MYAFHLIITSKTGSMQLNMMSAQFGTPCGGNNPDVPAAFGQSVHVDGAYVDNNLTGKTFRRVLSYGGPRVRKGLEEAVSTSWGIQRASPLSMPAEG